jgi:glycosyltransferase involved in cell wall biosynthesis
LNANNSINVEGGLVPISQVAKIKQPIVYPSMMCGLLQEASLQDNLPNTVMEALACGTPSVAFDIGGMSDMIVHKQNGYLAKPFDVHDLVRGLEWVVEQDKRKVRLSESSRKHVENKFELEYIARKYTDLYSKI